MASPMVRAMRYDEMRREVETHFRAVLKKHTARVNAEGDGSGRLLDTLRSSLSFVEDDLWLEEADQPDEHGNGLLSQF